MHSDVNPASKRQWKRRAQAIRTWAGAVTRAHFVLAMKRSKRSGAIRYPKFDGAFFTCVKTTKIYCRPICPSAHARQDNIFFVPSAAAAERLGYRPCLRCRPETAPGSPAWLGTATTVGRAMRLIGKESSMDTLGRNWRRSLVSEHDISCGCSADMSELRRARSPERGACKLPSD